MLKHIIPIIALSLVTACAFPQKKERSFNPELCDEQAGYEAGFEDGRAGLNMNTSFLNNCREDLRALAVKGYRAGFDKGLPIYKEESERRAKEMQQNKTTTGTSGFPIPGLFNRAGYYCKVMAFGKKYDAFGATEVEARKTVEDACAVDTHEMHCKQVQCQKNE